MFAAARRCPATLAKGLSVSAFSSKIVRLPLLQSSIVTRTSVPRVSTVANAAFHQSAKWRQVVAGEATQDDSVPAQNEPVTRFEDLATRGLVHPNIVNTITKSMKLETMTDVQTRTINEALSGIDVIAQAKTGTGKTLGFLIPVIQRIIQNDPKLGESIRGYKKARPDDIRAIIISPTRELAEQIAVEAKKVTQRTGIVVQTAVGGTQKREMLRRTQREGCHLLIGTPGRLNDILSDEYSGIQAPNLDALVMDEADRLLDQGFTEEIEQIKERLPDPEQVPRQTLMFSATIAREVVDLVRRTLRPGFHFAKCVDENEEPTHERVPQKVVHVQGFENVMPTLYELFIKESERSLLEDGRPFKPILYFNSTAEVTLAASVFYKLSGAKNFRSVKNDKPLAGLRCFEIHSKLSQAQRTRASDDFRRSKSAVLFSSDVTARGMDFPNVTHVIQVGLPRDRESYIHRLGRTGRAGKEGEGWLIATPFDRPDLYRRLRGLPLKNDDSLEAAKVDMTMESQIPEHVNKIIQECVEAHKKVYPDHLENAFRGLFGAYQGYPHKQEFIDGANRLAEYGWAMSNPPPPPASFMMGRSRRSGGGRSSSFGRGGYGGGGFNGGDRFNRRDNPRDGGNRRGGFGGRSGGYGDRSGSHGDRSGYRRFGDRGDRGSRDMGMRMEDF